jgi:glycosyltransferase involved in cell wall biosynthesis
VYAAADIFVFPSHADTFGLVMLEAMACGTPVAAFRVDGPTEVLGGDIGDGRARGGAMEADLQAACRQALAVPRSEARARALEFSWERASSLFEGFLVPARSVRPVAGNATVTNLSSP